MARNELAILCCMEAGTLESQSLLLLESLRAHGGRAADASFFALSLRPHAHPSRDNLARLRELGGEWISEPLNTEYDDYPIANKILGCAWAEQHLPQARQVFLDSDTVFVAEPARLLDFEGVVMRPVDNVGPGSRGESDPRDAYWQAAYALCGVTFAPPLVATTVDDVAIRPYFNAGLIGVRRESGFLALWKELFERLHRANLRPDWNPRCLDQIALACAAARMWPQVEVLPRSYNYPLPQRPRMPEQGRNLDWHELVHVHYHRWFQRPGFLDLLTPPMTGGPVTQWLEQRLPLPPVIDEAYPPWQQQA